MPFIANIAKLKSLAIVGTAKNVGKTESLNYILSSLHQRYPHLQLALTSIGIDGERRDQVTQTDKPEITLHEGMRFVTTENFFRQKSLPAEIFDIDRKYISSIGRLIYARGRGIGKTLIAGPSSTGGLHHVVHRMEQEGVNLTLIDGALSRLSLASPSVAEGMVLATGCAYSVQPEQLIKRMRELVCLILLPQLADRTLAKQLSEVERGVRLITNEGTIINPNFASAITPDIWHDTTWLSMGSMLYVPGVISDKLLNQLRLVRQHSQLVIKDFTRIFASGQTVQSYLASGREIKTLYSSKLMAITFNPLAPSGYRLNSERMCERLSETLSVPVYDVRKL